MLQQFFRRSWRQYVSLPIFGSVLDQFAKWLHRRGYAQTTIYVQFWRIRHIDAFFLAQHIKSIRSLTHEHFTKAERHFRRRRPIVVSTVGHLKKFVHETYGMPEPPVPVKTPVEMEIKYFCDYLKNVRGLQNKTIQLYTRYLTVFLKLINFNADQRALSDLGPKHIEKFIHHCSKSLHRHSLQHTIGYLRAFLKFEYNRGVLQRPLFEAIDTPRIYRLEHLPRSIPWVMVEKLLASMDKSNSTGIRDYAMLVLIAAYGLRSSDVTGLTLDHIIWKDSCLRILQRKTGKQLDLPLTDMAGEALIDYLKNARPHFSYREVFLSAQAPCRPLTPGAVNQIFKRCIRHSGLNIPRCGAHSLRHSYAVHLLRKKIPLKTIGDILGHHTVESTSVYLRLADEDLREAALDVPKYTNLNIQINPAAIKDIPVIRTIKNANRPKILRSFLKKEISSYLKLHRALGKQYVNEHNTLYFLDLFLVNDRPSVKELNAAVFARWCKTFAHVSPAAKFMRMRIFYKFCLYYQRSHPQTFIPDRSTFPLPRPQMIPCILSEKDIARLLNATQYMPSGRNNPMRRDTIRLMIILLYTCGLRRGELQRLKLADFDSARSTLLIKSTKFHKSRIIPLSCSTNIELRSYLNLRRQNNLPMEKHSALIWSRSSGDDHKCYSNYGLFYSWRWLCSSIGILDHRGTPPRIHDLRHSFAVNNLLRWYREGKDVQTRLPHLSTYMGHLNISSTQYYLKFIHPVCTSASTRFEKNCSNIIKISK